MSKKLKVVICVLMTCVFLLIPFSAFAYPDNPSAQTLYNIANDTGKPIYSGYQLICEDDTNFYFWTVESSNIRPSSSSNSYPCNISMSGGGASVQISTTVYTYPKSNYYDVSVSENKQGYYYDYQVNKLSNVTKILYSNKDVTYTSGDTTTVFFSLMNSIPKYPPGRVPVSTVISSIPLTGILKELTAMLPLLLPVLITFLAIRKGIAFCLQMLRTS